MSNTNTNTNTNTNNNNTKNNTNSQPQEEWYGGYRGGLLRWNTMRKQSRYTSRYKDNKMMRRILSTRINE